MPALVDTGAAWIAAATNAIDAVDVDGIHVKHLEIAPDDYRRYYDVIANGTLWFLHHNLFDLARRPRIDQHWWDAWHTYCEINDAFASLVADTSPEGAVVLVHDYHLALVGSTLYKLRPDLKTVHFHHTPFADRSTISTLPQPALQRLMDGLTASTLADFTHKLGPITSRLVAKT